MLIMLVVVSRMPAANLSTRGVALSLTTLSCFQGFMSCPPGIAAIIGMPTYYETSCLAGNHVKLTK